MISSAEPVGVLKDELVTIACGMASTTQHYRIITGQIAAGPNAH